jgi:hypothetical protein
MSLSSSSNIKKGEGGWERSDDGNVLELEHLGDH